jgi:2-iminobutanoate/2-iminopropanoate deaminase
VEAAVPIERINPPEIYPPYNDFYTQVVTATGSLQVHVAGTVGMDRAGQVVGEGDLRTQTRVTMDNIGKGLAAAGASPADVVRINIFTLDVDAYLRDAHQEVLAFFGDAKPVSTLVGVTRLAKPEFLVEIQATAVVG